MRRLLCREISDLTSHLFVALTLQLLVQQLRWDQELVVARRSLVHRVEATYVSETGQNFMVENTD